MKRNFFKNFKNINVSVKWKRNTKISLNTGNVKSRISQLFVVIYIFAGVQKACHLSCPLRIAIAT